MNKTQIDVRVIWAKQITVLIMVFGFVSPVWSETPKPIEYPTHFAHANNISIAYQDFGDKNDEVVLLVMGLGAQLIHWDDNFVHDLVAKGYRVIRFDNRDIGLSEKFYQLPNMGFFTLIRYKLGMSLAAPYLLDDMAQDAIGLMDHLNIQQAHVVGASMGGMIGQIMTAKHPRRVKSLASIMSTTSAKHLPMGSVILEPRDRSEMTREQVINETIGLLKAINGKESNISDVEWQQRVTRGYDRSHYDPGFGRQLWAILDSGDRVEMLKSITQPVTVIHGTIDPLVPIEHGRHTAELVNNATLVELNDMGHFMGTEHHARLIEAIVANIGRIK